MIAKGFYLHLFLIALTTLSLLLFVTILIIISTPDIVKFTLARLGPNCYHCILIVIVLICCYLNTYFVILLIDFDGGNNCMYK